MKLKQLTIDNIASIEHGEINFDAEPLAGEHLFLITGETGSGKSTIIDSLCLALYGDTPRLHAAKSAEYTSHHTDGTNDDSLRTDDVRQLLRRGAVSADVRLTFDDNDGTPYVASWHVHRSRNKVDGAIQKPVRTIATDEGATEHHHYAKKSELDDFAKRVIGLDMSQFFRTVVLAQGKFAEFLESDDNVKAALLEKMTGTEIYAQVGKKIYDTCKLKEETRNLLRSQVQDIDLLSDEEKSIITGEIDTFKQEHAAVQQRHAMATKMTQWLDEVAKNAQDLADKQRDLADKQAITQQPGHKDEQALVTDWETTTDARRELKALQDAQQQIRLLEQAKPAMQQEFDRLSAALRATIADIADKQTTLQEIFAQLKQGEPNKAMFEALQTIKTLVNKRETALLNIKAYSKALEQEKARLPKAEETLKLTVSGMQDIESKLKHTREEYNALGIEQVNNAKDDLNAARLALSNLKNHHTAVAQQTQALLEIQKERQGQQELLDNNNSSITDKRALVDELRKAVERMRDLNALVEQAHKTLHEGDKCPVCGNVITTLLVPKTSSALDVAQQQLAEAERQLKKAETDIGTATALIKRLDKQIADGDNELKSRTEQCDKLWQQAQGLLAKCGKKIEGTAINGLLDQLIGEIDLEIERLNNTLKQAQALSELITIERDKLTLATEKRNQAQIDLNHIKSSIEKQDDAIVSSKKQFQELTQELSGFFSYDDWQERVEEPGFIDKLAQEAAAYKTQQQRAQQLEHEIQLSQSLVPAMQAAKSKILGFEDHGLSTAEVPRGLNQLWNNLENRYLKWTTRLSTERAGADKAKKAIDAYLHGHPDIEMPRLMMLASQQQADINAIKLAHQALADSITLMLGEVQALTKRRNQIAATKPDFDVESPEQLASIIANAQKRIEELTNELSSRLLRLKADEENRRIMGEKKRLLDEAEAVYNQWAEFNSLLGSADGKTLRKIAQSYLLGELLGSANGYLRQFNDRYELEANPGTLTILVRDLLQGDRTAVTTLSGGESFMVSLALALALSSMSGKVFNVDTIFIDEGFGSLSAGYLDNVMETLNRLYDMGGRRVGIISHVEMLKERITTQIQVTRDPKDNTVSRIKVT